MKRLAIATTLVVCSTSAHADDKFDSLTLLPWSDTSFAISENDHRAVIQYSQLTKDGLGFHANVSAPLDDDTRIAAFTSNNKLVGGFAGSLQIGVDTRAERLAALESATHAVGDAVKQLTTIGRFARAQVDYATDQKLSGISTGELYVAMCKKFAGPDAECTVDNQNTIVPKMCAALRASGQACADQTQFNDIATAYWGQNCLAIQVDPVKHEACAIAGPLRDELALQHAAEIVRSTLGNQDLVDEIWTVYKYLAPDAAKQCAKRTSDCILDNAQIVADTIGDFVKNAPLQRRDLLMFAIQDRSAYAILGSVSGSFDRSSVYQDDISSTPVSSSSYDLQVGVDATWYTPRKGLSANLRLGYERSRAVNAQTFQRCEVAPGSNTTVSGTACDPNALFRVGPAPDAASSLYARGAVDYQFDTSLENNTIVPGVEERLGLDNIGDGTTLSTRASLFATPVSGTTAARIGVALDIQHPLDSGATPSWIVTPLVFIGATFSDLMTN